VNLLISLMQTLAVLNPLGRIDQHIMDDSDLAGPILFFLMFGTFLLFVCGTIMVYIGISANKFLSQAKSISVIYTGSR
jgi:hypothetical protein